MAGWIASKSPATSSRHPGSGMRPATLLRSGSACLPPGACTSGRSPGGCDRPTCAEPLANDGKYNRAPLLTCGQALRFWGSFRPPSTLRAMTTTSPTTWVEDIRKEPVRWAVPDYIPRRVVSSLYGPRNSGKTLAAVWLATEAARTGLRVWMNSREDDLPSVLKPRFDATGGILAKQVRLTGNPWRLPSHLPQVREALALHKASGTPDHIVILGSITPHLTR